MKIAVCGEQSRVEEFKSIIGSHELTVIENADADFSEFDLIADMNADDELTIPDSAFSSGKFILLCAVKKTLLDILKEKKISSQVAGINALPTFLNRPVQEISFLKKENEEQWKNIFSELNWKIKVVKDEVGMVSPRILFMIINEASFTLDEGTASASDIDSGMKLGTAYPEGPLAWADKIGVKNIYETLLAMKMKSNDSRYKISGLLEKHFLSKTNFSLAE